MSSVSRDTPARRRLDSLPPEILCLILSNLPVLDFFPLKIAGSRRITDTIRNDTYLDRDVYMCAIQHEDRQRCGKKRPLMEIMIARGQTVLLVEHVDETFPPPSETPETSAPWTTSRGIQRERDKGIRQSQDDVIISAFHVAAKYGSDPVIKSLLARRWVEIDAADHQGMTALHFASGHGREDTARLLVNRGARVEKQSKDNLTALHLASLHGSDEIVKFLLLKKASVNAQGKSGLTPLAMASRNGRLSIVELLLNKGADIQIRSTFRKTAFHYAAGRGHLAITKLLLDHPSAMRKNPKHFAEGIKSALDFAARGGHSETACLLLEEVKVAKERRLHCTDAVRAAAFHSHVKTVKVLLEYQACLQGEGVSKSSLLCVAARNGNENIVCLLLDMGTPVDQRDEHQMTALHHTASAHDPTQNDIPMVDLLLDKGADIEAKFDGLTPLLLAIQAWRPSYKFARPLAIVRRLLQSGANVHARDSDGNTTLHINALLESSQSKYDFVTNMLLDHGADPKARNNAGETPLHTLAGSHTRLLPLLLDRGADKEACDNKGRTVLHTAAKGQWHNSIKLLLQRRSNVHAKDNDGLTPLHFATMGGDVVIVRHLLDAGADVNAQDESGKTALHYVADLDWREARQLMYELLKDRGADLHVTDSEGRRPGDLLRSMIERKSLKKYPRRSGVK